MRTYKSQMSSIWSQIAELVDERFGTTPGGSTRPVAYDEIAQVVVSTTNKGLVGLPLCRDQQYLDLLLWYNQWVAISDLWLLIFPRILRPIPGTIVRFLGWLLVARPLHAKLAPIVESYMRRDDEKADGVEKLPPFFQEVIKVDSAVMTPKTLAETVIAVSFAAIRTTTIIATNMVYEVLSHPDAAMLLEDIRQEVETALGGDLTDMTRDKLQKMRLLDSIARETLRLRAMDRIIHMRSVARKVQVPEGVTLEPGITTAFPMFAVHGDETTYPNASEFNPYRFMQTPELQSYALGEDFLTFGHGPHACSGRWLATSYLKMLFAQLVLKYDIEPLEKRPRPFHLATMELPSLSQRVTFTRRESTE